MFYLGLPLDQDEDPQNSDEDESITRDARQQRKTNHDGYQGQSVDGGPDKVELFSFAFGPFPFQFPERQKKDHEAQRDIKNKKTSPTKMLCEKPSHDGSKRKSTVNSRHIDSKCFPSFFSRKYRGENGHRGGKNHGGSYSLNDAETDDHPPRGGKSQKKGGHRVNQYPIAKHLFPPIEICYPPKGDKQCRGR